MMNQKTFEFDDSPFPFCDDKVLTSSEVRQLIARGLAEKKEVVLVIGERRRVISWIGEEVLHDMHPRSPRWRVEIEK